MANIWIISDTHLNHENMLKFKRDDGTLVRDFHDVHHMNEIIIQNWNKLVKPQDKIYHLGDVYMGSQQDADRLLSRLNGKKRLIVGNHDCIYGKGNILQKYFQKIYMWRVFREFNMTLTHVPIHESSFRGGDYNVHGHIHYKDSPSDKHINVCVEKTDYMPVNIEDVIRKYG